MSSSDVAPSFDSVVSPSNLVRAWDHVRRRASAPGVDRETVEAFEIHAVPRLEKLAAALASGVYRPRAARRLQIASDPDRPLTIPAVRDRIVQRAVALGLGPFYERRFSAAAMGYRPGRGVEAAIAVAARALADGRRWFVRTDIAKFFDRIDRDRLLAMMREDGLDERTLALVRHLLGAGVERGAVWIDSGVGVGQGSALSPLLSNVYLRPVDRAMEEAGFRFLRYADDVLVLAESEAETQDALARLQDALVPLGLRLGPRKTRRGHVGEGFQFLGMRFDSSGPSVERGALEHLEAQVAALGGTPSRVVELMQEWARWYPLPSPDTVETLGVLAAFVLVAKSDLASWAERRLAFEGALAPGLHVALVEVWVRSDERAAQRAAVIDAALGAACDDVALRERIASALAIDTDAVVALAKGDAVAQVLARAGRPELAAAARGRRPRASVVRPAEAAHERAASMLRGLRVREDVHGIERASAQGHFSVRSSDRALGVDDLVEHLSGGPRRYGYVVREDGTVGVAVVEISVRREVMLPPWVLGEPDVRGRWASLRASAHDFAVAVMREGDSVGIVSHLETSGIHDRRVWFLFEEVHPVRHVRALLWRLCRGVGDAPAELSVRRVPHQDGVGRGLGPCVVLPGGVAPRTLERSVWLDRRGDVLDAGPEHLAEAQRVPGEVVRSVVLPPRRGGRVDAEDVPMVANARTVLEGCAVLEALAGKARRLGRLDGAERRTIYESLGHLDEASRAGALQSILGAAGDSPSLVRRTLKRLTAHPISCASIRRRHPALTSEVGCSCEFVPLPTGAYGTPVLHVLRPGEVMAFRRGRGSAAMGGEVQRRFDAFRRAATALAEAQRRLRAAAEGLDACFQRAGSDRIPMGSKVLRRDAKSPLVVSVEISGDSGRGDPRGVGDVAEGAGSAEDLRAEEVRGSKRKGRGRRRKRKGRGLREKGGGGTDS